MSIRPSFSLTPMSGLGSYNRNVGAVAISQPRNSIGSANRVYQYMKNQVGSYVATNQIQMQVFGPNFSYYNYKNKYNSNKIFQSGMLSSVSETVLCYPNGPDCQSPFGWRCPKGCACVDCAKCSC